MWVKKASKNCYKVLKEYLIKVCAKGTKWRVYRYCHQSRFGSLLSSRWKHEKSKGKCNIFLGLRSFRTITIGKLRHVTYVHEHLVKYMTQNSKKGLLLFGFGVFFLRINVLGYLWRDIALRWYPMLLQWIALSMQCYVLDKIFALL